MFCWCMETKAEWDAAADCLALRIREIWPSNRCFHPQDLQVFIRKVDMSTVAADSSLVPET